MFTQRKAVDCSLKFYFLLSAMQTYAFSAAKEKRFKYHSQAHNWFMFINCKQKIRGDVRLTGLRIPICLCYDIVMRTYVDRDAQTLTEDFGADQKKEKCGLLTDHI